LADVFLWRGHLRLESSCVQANTVLTLHIILPVYFSVHHVNKSILMIRVENLKKLQFTA